jgi:predicted RNA-binding protein with PUA-like domain
MAEKRYWLFKTEPEAFSIADLAAAPAKSAFWDGVRNYQARNYLRDDVRAGDEVLVYHSSVDPPHVAGVAKVAKAAEPDPTQFQPGHDHFDPRAKAGAPPWVGVTLKHVRTFKAPVDRAALAADPVAKTMEVLRRGSRLSIQPVSKAQFDAVIRLAR